MDKIIINFVETKCNHYTVTMIKSCFQTFVVLWMLYSSFWVIPRPLNFTCRRFGTLRSIFIGRLVYTTYGDRTQCSETSVHKIKSQEIIQKKKYINDKTFCKSPRTCHNYLCWNMCSISLRGLGFSQRCWWGRGTESDLFVTTVIQSRGSCMAQCWNDTDRLKPTYPKKIMSRRSTIHNKSHMHWSGIEPSPPYW